MSYALKPKKFNVKGHLIQQIFVILHLQLFCRFFESTNDMQLLHQKPVITREPVSVIKQLTFSRISVSHTSFIWVLQPFKHCHFTNDWLSQFTTKIKQSFLKTKNIQVLANIHATDVLSSSTSVLGWFEWWKNEWVMGGAVRCGAYSFTSFCWFLFCWFLYSDLFEQWLSSRFSNCALQVKNYLSRILFYRIYLFSKIKKCPWKHYFLI